MQERRQVFDIGEAKNVDILGGGSSNVFDLRLKIPARLFTVLFIY